MEDLKKIAAAFAFALLVDRLYAAAKTQTPQIKNKAMTVYKNIINTVRRKRPDDKRKLSDVTHIVLHHTGWTRDATPDDIAKIHISERLFRSIGYHFLIMKDGTVYQCKGLDDVGSHAAKFNQRSIGIACNGNFELEQPTEAQLKSVEATIKKINKTLGRKLTVIGHKDVIKIEPDATKTVCPGKNYPLQIFKRL